MRRLVASASLTAGRALTGVGLCERPREVSTSGGDSRGMRLADINFWPASFEQFGTANGDRWVPLLSDRWPFKGSCSHQLSAVANNTRRIAGRVTNPSPPSAYDRRLLDGSKLRPATGALRLNRHC